MINGRAAPLVLRLREWPSELYDPILRRTSLATYRNNN
jgi:hypothetical protein